METTDEQAPPATASAPSADDMLAQLAGAEIDRLLAEAETDAPPASPVESLAPPETAPADAIAQSAAEEPAPSNEPPRINPDPTDAVHAAPTEQATLDPAPVVEQAIAAPAEANEIVAAPAAPAAPAPEPAVAPSQLQLAAEGAILAPPRAIGKSDDDRPLPTYVRVLEVLGSPLDSFPDWVRNAVGALGVASFFNAMTILVYLHFFRHK